MSDAPPPPPGFTVVPPPPPGFAVTGDVALEGKRFGIDPSHVIANAFFGVPTGEAHDGDTFRLSGGANARLEGVDAFELDQQGRAPDGTPVDLGQQARSALLPYLTPSAAVTPNGTETYGRPVVALDSEGVDAGKALLDQGMALATPEYLRADPARFQQYMDAERLARLNRRGAFADSFETPSAYRHGQPQPWAEAKPGAAGDPNSEVVFWDQPTPFQGLRPEIAKGLQTLYADPTSTPDEIMGYAKANGFELDPDQVAEFVKERAKPGAVVDPTVRYHRVPRVLTDTGDGAFGAFVRGAADPINMLDEIGGLGDALIPNALRAKGQERENVWSSDRRFGDILANNVDQDRSILEHDEVYHPWARTGGQVAGGLVVPGASAESIGTAALREALDAGVGEYAARNIAKRAVTRSLATTGAVESGLAGAGAGDDWRSRLTGALTMAPIGAVVGAGTGAILPKLAGVFGKRAAGDATQEAERAAASLDPEASTPPTAEPVPPPPPGFKTVGEDFPIASRDSAPSAKSMANETVVPSITAPAEAVTAGATSSATGVARPLLDPATFAERQAQAERLAPGDVLPLPSNTVDGVAEAAGIDAGRMVPVRAPNEADALARRNIPSPIDGTRTMPKRGPLDLVTWLRTQGGLKPQGGELAHYGIDNAARKGMDFAGGEQRFGKLVDPEAGMALDDAAQRAHEAGYFPDHLERPTVAEFLDALHSTHSGRNRYFHPDDLAEVDAFDAARADRHAVEAAAQAGAPLVTDRGQPIDLADLEANSPPIEAYHEWGENAPNLAGNIRLDKLESPQAIKRALAVTDQRVGGFDAARRGRITQAETESLAGELGMTPADLLARRKGQALNAEQALAARQILAKSGNELVNLAKRVKGGSDADLAAFREAWTRHVAIQEQVAGATAEAGRTLAQFRMAANSRAIRGDVLKSLADGPRGREHVEDVADKIVELEKTGVGPGGVNRFAARAIKPRFSDKLVELYYNSLLSGPQTHVVNMMSNTLTALGQLPEHAVAATLGAGRAAFNRNVADRVLFTELGARTAGMIQGAREGMRAAVRSFRTGETSDLTSKVEEQAHKAISGRKGDLIRIPTRALSAEDELFKGMARRMELAGLSVRQARAEGLKGAAAKARAAELVSNPTDDMLAKSFDYGRYITFQRQLGPLGTKVSQITQAAPVLKLFLPFVRTPTNLVKFAVERSPAALLLKEWRADMLAGGARRDLAIAKTAVGTGMMALVAELTAQGKITGGGPADDMAKGIKRADGWQPYSLKIGDRYYSYSRLDPFSTTIGLAADMVDLQSHMTDKQKDDVAGLLVASTLQNLASKTWLSGVSELVNAVDDPERYGGHMIQKMAGSIVVPAAVAQVARTTDPVLRETQGWVDAIRARVPLLSKDLPARLDVWGRPITNEGGLGPDIVSPIWTSTAENDPVDAAVLESGARVSAPGRYLGNETLPDAQYQHYAMAAGKLAHDRLTALVSGPGWASVPRAARSDMIEDTVRKARREVRDQMFGKPASKRGGAAVVAPPPPPGFSMVR